LLVAVTEVRSTAAIVWARAARPAADVPCNKPDTVPGAAFRATTLAEFRARHRYNREDPALQDFLRRTPVYAIWDDHEVKDDFAGPTEALMPAGRQAFIDYWPVAAGADPTRLYRSVRWGRLLEVFILDTRPVSQ
jgi:alkaline phosphatase D